MDILVNCLAAFAALCHWRLVVSLAACLLAAVVLAQLVPWFTGGMGLWLVLFACGVGMLWEGDASAGAATAPAASAAIGEARPQGMLISRPVAALGLCLIGMVWGGLLGMWMGSLWAGTAVLVAASFAVGMLWAWGLQRPVPWAYMAFAACALLSGAGVLRVLVEMTERV